MLKSAAVLFSLAIAGLIFAQRDFPPRRPDPVPTFVLPRPGESPLDEGWQYEQTLADADPAYPELLNAYPLQMAFTHGGRGFLATLHTIFFTDNGGRTWRNLDPFPPPGLSEFSSLRAPIYLTGIAARPVVRTAIGTDSLFLSMLDAGSNQGRVRLLRYVTGGYHLLPDTARLFVGPNALTGIVLPDSDSVYALAGYDRKVYYRDSLRYGVFTRWDSLYASTSGQWVPSIVERADSLLIAVGGEQWVTRDAGQTWTAAPAADALGDYGVSFADALHGLVCGGHRDPSAGWVHVTTDGGQTWSGRTLSTFYPMRCVEMVTPTLGYAAGGDYHAGGGEIWKTEDGGQTWTFELQTTAEITVLASVRVSGAYVNVIAAGVFPDFHGGIWRNQLYLPDTSGAVLLIEPDTLDFGEVARGDTGFVPFVIHNVGNDTARFFGVSGSRPEFSATNIAYGTVIAPGGELPMQGFFVPPPNDSLLDYSGVITIASADGNTEVFARGSVPLGGSDPRARVPKSPSLSVFPNPGNAIFQIRFEIPRAQNAMLRVYDVTGREVANLRQGSQDAGWHVVSWNATNSASGIYFVRLETRDARLTRKLLLLK